MRVAGAGQEGGRVEQKDEGGEVKLEAKASFDEACARQRPWRVQHGGRMVVEEDQRDWVGMDVGLAEWRAVCGSGRRGRSLLSSQTWRLTNLSSFCPHLIASLHCPPLTHQPPNTPTRPSPTLSVFKMGRRPAKCYRYCKNKPFPKSRSVPPPSLLPLSLPPLAVAFNDRC